MICESGRRICLQMDRLSGDGVMESQKLGVQQISSIAGKAGKAFKGPAGHAVQTIKVKVATPETATWRRPPPERHISASARASLTQFAATLPADSPLRASLERLAQRSRE